FFDGEIQFAKPSPSFRTSEAERSEDPESRKFKNLLDPGSPLRCGRDDGLRSFKIDQAGLF
ncbi:MAG: hypothetical protein K9K88_09945, partial [Desulfobacterales bacterium]|nr:hypothetical protein [Desulfobacterales bacterium]